MPAERLGLALLGGLAALCAPLLAQTTGAAPPASPLTLTTLEMRAGFPVEDFACKARARRPSPSKPDPDPLEMPQEDELEALLRTPAAPAAHALPPGLLARQGERLRVAVWGDSHMAAAFFTDELLRIAGLDGASARPSLLAANFARPGVRLPVRRHCANGEWRYESAHAVPQAAARPGPGLMSMFTSEVGAELALDLRTAQGGQNGPLRLLYEATGSPLRLGISVDAQAEVEVLLPASSGAAALELRPDAPLSQLRVRLLEGSLRLQGLAFAPSPRARLQLDLFAYPGATVAAWAKAEADPLRVWFAPDAYDLIVLGYGTNEGNANPFVAEAYRQSLAAALARLREVFPHAQCILVGPGDRGTLLRRSQKRTRGAGVPPTALLRYSRIHQEVASIQQTQARAHGCAFWNAQEAMGGPGSAFQWGRSGLMAPDLIHFTVKGYQQLAQSFARALDWTPATVAPRPAPPR